MVSEENFQVHQLSEYIQSIYLIQEKDSLFLLDGCCSCDFKHIKSFIEEELRLNLKHLKLVISTHAHPDHMGALHKFKHHGIAIAGPKDINQWYRGLSCFFTYSIDICLTYLVALNKKQKLRNIIFPRQINLDYYLEEGQNIPGFSDWKVLECPGHTAIDLSIYHTKKKIAYIADNIVSSRNKTFRPYPVCFPDLYKSSLKKYIDFGIEDFLIAHYGQIKISSKTIADLMASTPASPRNHRNTILKILTKLLGRYIGKK